MITKHLSKSQIKNIERIVLLLINRNAPVNGINEHETLFSAIKELSNTSIFRIDKSETDLLTDLRDIFLPLAENMLGDRISYCEFPFNVRVSHPQAPKSYLSSDFPTDELHCDPWYGEPKHSTNFLYFVYLSERSSSVEFYDVEDSYLNTLKRYQGPYGGFDWSSVELGAVSRVEESGQLIMFDAYTPHRTIRSGEDIRISVDFRVIKRCESETGVIPRKVRQKYEKVEKIV